MASGCGERASRRMTALTAPPTAAGTLRLGFVMEQVLGHVAHYRTLREALDADSTIDPRWVEVTYKADAAIERLLPAPAALRSTLRGFHETRGGLSGRRFDALYFHTHKPAVFQWDLLQRIPSVLSLDVTPRQYDALGEFYDHRPDGDSPVSRLKDWMNRRTFQLARGLVVWSNWVKTSLVSDYGVPSEKVKVVAPGVDLELWSRPHGEAPGDTLPRVLFVGGDFARKGGDLLLDWFHERGRTLCELDLVTRADIANEPGVRVHRDISPNTPQARRLFFDADVFVLPSLGECFGIASAEAMAAGIPVITTRVGGSEDIVDDGENGFLIPPGDGRALAQGLDRLLANSDLRCSLGQRARAKAERCFDSRHNAKTIVAELRRVAATA
jgi:glycosyltransferase involved in cell wall biosynthesis